MEEKLSKELAGLLEILHNIVLGHEGLINLLEKKGIITKSDLFREIKKLEDKHKTAQE